MRFAMLLAILVAPMVPERAEAASPSAEAVPVDAGLAVTVSGKVTVKPNGKAPALDVTPYMKLRVGDEIAVGPDGKLDIVYFGGRRESWAPGAVVRVGASSGEAVSGGAAKVSDAGPAVGASLESLPIVLRHAEAERAGQTLVRGGAAKSAEELALDEAELAQVQTADKADILPEMYLVSVLVPYQLHTEAVAVLEKAVLACPSCAEAQLLLDVERGRVTKK
jgi:hypothetical protein